MCLLRGADSWSDLAGQGKNSSSSSSSQPVQAPRLSHWSKYGTAGSAEPVRGDPSVRGGRRYRDWSGSDRDSDRSPADDGDGVALSAQAAPADVTGNAGRTADSLCWQCFHRLSVLPYAAILAPSYRAQAHCYAGVWCTPCRGSSSSSSSSSGACGDVIRG